MQPPTAAHAATAAGSGAPAPRGASSPREPASAVTPSAGPEGTARSGTASPRVVLVTGAARRLGREIALALARDGWDVGVHYANSGDAARETAEEIRQLGRRAVCLKARLEDEQAASRLVDELAEQLGPVRGLVNNASHFMHDDIETVDAASLAAHLLPNLVAPLLLSRTFFRALKEALPGQPGAP